MDAFESLVETLLKRQGYWTRTGFKIDLTKEEKRRVGRPTSPRWELDVVAYQGSTNSILAVECKSFLDSTGVLFQNGEFKPPTRYKLFTDPSLRKVVLHRLKAQMVKSGAVAPNPTVSLGLAVGHIASNSDRDGLRRHMERNGWRLIDESDIVREIRQAADAGYEDDVAHVVAKLLCRARDARD